MVNLLLSLSSPGEKPFLCDKCGRGFNRVDNLRSHVKTVHQGKAGMKILEPEDGSELNIVTVASDDMVTLATEALAATAVTQLTGELWALAVGYFGVGRISHGLNLAWPRVLAAPSASLLSPFFQWSPWRPL